MSNNYPYIFGPKKKNSIEKTISAERLKEIREQIDQYRRQESKSSKTVTSDFGKTKEA